MIITPGCREKATVTSKLFLVLVNLAVFIHSKKMVHNTFVIVELIVHIEPYNPS